MTSTQFEQAAKAAVQDFLMEHYGEKYALDDLNLVWFCHILGCKKCLIVDSGANTRYYEITYNPKENELYIDVYVKKHNWAMKL